VARQASAILQKKSGTKSLIAAGVPDADELRDTDMEIEIAPVLFDDWNS
jgi:hypothetical protein